MEYGVIKVIVALGCIISNVRDFVDGATLGPGGTDVCKLPDNQRVIIQGGCNFNNGDCGWTFPNYLWSRHNETTGMVIFGPTDNDIGRQKASLCRNGKMKTYGPVSTIFSGLLQRFAVFQSNDANVNMSTVAAIISPTIHGTGSICLKFWILMPNQNSRLEIYMMSKGESSRLIYDYKQTLTSQWKKIEIPIYAVDSFTVIFRSEKENNYGYIGIDSIQFYMEKLPTTTTTEPTTTSTTTETTTMTSKMPTKPTTTLTTTTTVDTTSTRTTAEPTTSSSTFRIFSTTTMSTTNPTTTTTPTPITAVTTSPTLSSSISTTSPSTSTTSTSTFATTAQTISRCKCDCPTYESKCLRTTTTPVTPIPKVCAMPETNRMKKPSLSCNFDKDTCQYTIPVYPHLWERTLNRFGNERIGEIDGDQSTDQSGGYMLFSTYNNHVQNNQTHYIQTPVLRTDSTYCLSFWYTMPTNHSNLAVFVKYTDGSSSKLVWKIRNEQHNSWTHQYLELSENKPFFVVFESIKDSFFSFLGLDNVEISEDNRPRTTISAAPSVTTNRTSSPDPNCQCTCPDIDCDATSPPPYVKPPCGDLSMATKIRYLSCDFDNGDFCGYNVPVYPHLWERHMFEYGSSPNGMIYGDSTKDGDGGYLLFNTDNHHVQSGQTDEVTSLEIFIDPDMCLSFVYNKPTTNSSLLVYQAINGQRTLVWELTNTTTTGWTEANVFLPYSTPPYNIIFSSKKSGLDSYLGIDNIEVFSNLAV